MNQLVKSACVLSFIFIFSSTVYGQVSTTTATTTGDTIVASTTVNAIVLTVASSSATNTVTIPSPDYRSRAVVESTVRSFFKDIPVMISIALCESRFTQFDANGSPLDGGSGGMVGIFQISKRVHDAFARMIGYDINTVEGNIGYAKYLYQKEGTNPWISSFPCWNVATNNPESTSTSQATTGTQPALVANTNVLTTNLSFGMVHPQVVLLQQLLNKLGYTITSDRPGSPGNETTKFGSLTRVSIRKFQCANNIVCSGDEGSTGYGYVGARTRSLLMSATPVTTGNNSQIASSTSAQAQVADTKAVKILELQTQVTQYQKMINDLQAQISALRGW